MNLLYSDFLFLISFRVYQALKLIRTTIEYLKILLLLLHLKNPTQIKSILRMLGESINFPQENMLEIN